MPSTYCSTGPESARIGAAPDAQVGAVPPPDFSGIAVTRYANAYDNQGQPSNLQAILDEIRSSALKKTVEWLRTLNKPEYDRAKPQLPAVTFSGKFERRAIAGLIEHSRIVVLDLDHLDDPEALKAQLAANPAVLSVFTSPSGTGLKILIACTAPENVKNPNAKWWGRKHLDFWQSAILTLPAELQKTVDPSGKDVSRLCFLSWDPHPYIIPEEQRPTPILPTSQARVDTPDTPDLATATDADKAKDALGYLAQKKVAEDDSHFLAVANCLKAMGHRFAEFDSWAAQAGCSCTDRQQRWESLSPADHDYSAIIGLAWNMDWRLAQSTDDILRDALGDECQDMQEDANHQTRGKRPKEKTHSMFNSDQPRDGISGHWVVETCGDSLRSYLDTFAVKTPAGLWVPYQSRALDSKSALGSVIQSRGAETGCPVEAQPWLTPKVYAGIIEQVHIAKRDGKFKELDPLEMAQMPIVPYSDGSHQHLDRPDLAAACRCDLNGIGWLDLGWRIPPVDWELLDKPPTLFEQFPEGVFRLLARYLHGPQKAQDIVRAVVADAGKPALALALCQALPGAAVHIDAATHFEPGRSRFTPGLIPLTEARIVVYDEMGRSEASLTRSIFSMSDPYVPIEKKGRDMARAPRIGSGLFIGHSFPDVDLSEQGTDQRVGAVWDFPSLQAISADMRDLWLTAKQTARLRAWIIWLAMQTWGTRNAKPWLTPERSELLKTEFIPQAVTVLRETFQHRSPDELIPSKEIDQAFKDAGVAVPKTKAKSKVVQQAWPKAQNSSDGTTRGWKGIGNAETIEGISRL